MATGDRGVARRAKTGGFGGVPLGFATDAPRGSAGSFTEVGLTQEPKDSKNSVDNQEGGFL
jgi:hypothetical protein